MAKRPPILAPTPAPRFRRVPPAVFPALLGLLGLVAAWYRAADTLGVPTALIDAAAGMVSLLFGFSVALYAVKVGLRPGVIVDDAQTLPGRTGVAALALGCIVLASLLVGRSAGLATLLTVVGVAMLSALAPWVMLRRLRGSDTAGPITPAMHLVFVGFVLIPTAAIPLNVLVPAMPWLMLYCTLAALVILAKTLPSLLRGDGAPPLRPLHVIHLAPPAFIATGLFLTGFNQLGSYALIWAVIIAALLLFRLSWIVEGSFSPMWAAFTFPVTALAGALLMGGDQLGVRPVTVAGGIVLIAATLYIPVIAFRILKLWAAGTLAITTNAATA